MILFCNELHEEPVYGMQLSCAGDVRVENDLQCSDWVMQLVGKDWCPTQTLYEFAAMIRSLGLDSEIDWYATFEIVERKKYLDAANELRDMANPKREDKMTLCHLVT